MSTSPLSPISLFELHDRHYEPGDLAVKQDGYLRRYEEFFGPIRYDPLKILELGIYNGSSMRLWKEYFQRASFVGIDIRDPVIDLESDGRAKIFQGSQGDEEVLKKAAVAVGGQFNIIIDDASHRGGLTIKSFDFLFRNHLSSGGIYVIEDYGAPLMKGYYDGAPYTPPPSPDEQIDNHVFPSYSNGLLGALKQLVDHLVLKPEDGVSPYPIASMSLFPHIAFICRA